MSQPDIQEALFVVSQPAVRKVARKASSGATRWAKYRPVNPVKCDDCMLVLFVAEGNAPASRQARWKRSQGGEYLLLCYGHADLRRAEDGLKPLSERA